MASIPCSIHVDVPSSSAWRRPSAPPPPSEPGSAGRLRAPFLGPTTTLARHRGSSRLGSEVHPRGGRVVANCRGAGISGIPFLCDGDGVDRIKVQSTSRFCMRHRQFSKQVKFSSNSLNFIVSPLCLLSMVEWANIRWIRPLSATGGSEVTSEDSHPSSMASGKAISEPNDIESVKPEGADSDSQLSSSNAQPTISKPDKTTLETQGGTTKRPPLTAREKLRAARVLSRYTESRPSRSELGSRVLNAIIKTDRGKKRSGLPEAPSNLFDDSKRGLPKQGLTFNLPGDTDIFFIVLSFVFISTVMFATTYIVWKAGAIHFNEY